MERWHFHHCIQRSTGLVMILATGLDASTAHARAIFRAPEDLSLEILLKDPVGLAIGITLLIAFIAGAWFVLRRAPLTADLERQRDDFLQALPANAYGYKAVLYRDEVQGMQGAAGQLRNHRIVVQLVHEKPDKTKTLYRKDEMPTLHGMIDTKASTKAADLWLETVADKDLPAVCATRKGIQKLEEKHFSDIKKNRVRFLKKLHSRMWVNSRRPAG